jgi:hypothetical protein
MEQTDASGDDLQRIDRISRTAERRLRSAGVRTWADLAARSPEEIARIVSVRAERIEREDWIGQAAELAEGAPPAAEAVEQPVSPSEDREHYESFMVTLTVDDDNQVIRTAATHVGTEHEEPWAGWDAERLLGFFARYATLPGRSATTVGAAEAAGEVEPGPPAGQVPSESSPTPVPAPVEESATRAPAPAPSLLRFEVVSLASGAVQWLLKAGEPFAVRLTFGAPEGPPSGRQPIGYTARVVATALGGRGQRTVGEEAGQFDPAGATLVELRSDAGLPEGFYQLEGVVLLGGGASARPARLLPLQGRVLQVD